jgi:hypothetical protein
LSAGDEQLAAAVAELGALPMPVGSQPQELDGVRKHIAELVYATYGQRDTERTLGIADAVMPAVRAALVSATAGLLARVAELEAERHTTNEALDDAVQALRADRTEPDAPYVSRLLPPRDAVCARPECGHWGEDHHHGDTKCWAHLPRTRGAFGVMSPIEICGCSGFVAAPPVEESADRLTGSFAPVAALREDPPAEDVSRPVAKLRALLAGQREAVDGEHYAAVHHSYRTPRDLPGTGGAPC